MQTQSVSINEIDAQNTNLIDEAILNNAAIIPNPENPRNLERSYSLKSKIAHLTAIYNNTSGKKPPVYKHAPQEIETEGFPANFRLFGDSLISPTSQNQPTKTPTTIQKLNGVIPASLRLGKTFIQNHPPVMTPQAAMNSAHGFSFLSNTAAKPKTINHSEYAMRKEIEENKSEGKVVPKLRRAAESCSRSTASNSTVKQQDSIKAISSFTGEKNVSRQKPRKCNDKRLCEVLDKVKGMLEEYKKREEILLKQNNDLKKELADLRKVVNSNIKESNAE